MSAIFEVSGLQKNFGGLVVTNNVSLSLSPGDRTVLIGPNGAGKTTFVNLVTGNIKPSAGSVRIAGEDVTGLSASQRVKRGLVRSFQVTRLFQDMTPEEHVALAILQREGKTGRIFGRYRAMPSVMSEARDILGTLGLLGLAETRVREIAYGQQRLIEIALAMALRPKILLLDEPAAGVPSTETARISVPAGSRFAVLGRNGVGKTSLFATLAGQTKRFSGDIRIGGQDIAALPSAARARAGLGYVPQTRDVFPTLTVEENLFVGLKGRPKSAIEEAYTLFPRLKERRRNLGSQLSGGEQQMLSTARTILGQPKVLLLDEPLEGLAPVICEELMAAFSKLAQSGEMTILLVEQRIQMAIDFADHAIIMERGRIVWEGPSVDLAANPDIVDTHLGVGGLH